MRPRNLMAGVLIGGFALLQWLGRTAGATRAERRARLPGDEIVPRATLVTTHATTIDAPAAAIWPWLVQMGWHQGGWYTSRWVDRLLFPANRAAADRILPEFQSRQVGDFVPDGPPDSQCGFVIERLEPDSLMVLHSTTHLPLSWRQKLGARLDWTWSFVLEPLGSRRTRLVFRCRGKASPFWVIALYQVAIVPADYIMSRQMLKGITRRAARTESRGASEPAVPVLVT